MSVDGFIAGPAVTPDQPLGQGGERLHDWLFVNTTTDDRRVVAELLETSGAVILGSWTYAVAIETVWEYSSPFLFPAFVLCREGPVVETEGFTFVTGGIGNALAEARNAAMGKNVWVMGGAHTTQQFLRAGLLDELHIHIAPLLLARGTRLFEDFGRNQIDLRKLKVVTTPASSRWRRTSVSVVPSRWAS